MASLKLNGDTSGTVTLTVPAVAGTNTLTLPAVTDTLVGLAATQTLTNKTLTSPIMTGTPTGPGIGAYTFISQQTASVSTSIEFTNLGSYVALRLLGYDILGSTTSSSSLIQLSSDNGSTYISTATYTHNFNWATSATATGWSNLTGQNELDFTDASASGSSFELVLHNFNIAKPTSVMGMANATNGRRAFRGYQTSNTVMNAFKIYQRTGTITTGTFILEGIIG